MLQNFLSNTEFSIREAQDFALFRAKGMNIENIVNFFDLLGNVTIKSGFLKKPSYIFNMVEIGV